MKQQVSLQDFGKLVTKLIPALPRALDAQSAAQIACDLLDGDIACIYQGEKASEGIIAVHPKDKLEWAKQQIDEVRARFELDPHPKTDVGGFSLEEPLDLQQAGRYGDALIAFGNGKSKGVNDWQSVELIVLKSLAAQTRYRSYHCSIGASIIRLLEQMLKERKARKVAESERRLSDAYARLLGKEVLQNIEWPEFVKQHRAINTDRAASDVSLGVFAVQWAGYQRRAGKIDRLSLDAVLQDAGEYREIIECLNAEDQALGKQVLDVVQRSICPGQRDRKQADEARRAALLVVEHGWRRLREAASSPSCKLPEPETYEALLSATQQLVMGALDAQVSAAGLELRRDTLRLYLAALLASAGRLREQFLGLDRCDDSRCVCRELKRDFVLNLSRYMLGAVQILEESSGVEVDPVAVSRLELLDALLNVVDRYAHVELGVDDCLDIREHLSRGFSAEIRRHLGNSYYRDHILHVIDVFLLGHILLDTRLHWLDGESLPLAQHLARLVQGNALEAPRNLADDWYREWAVAALLHDIDYQLDRKKGAAPNPEAIKAFFRLRGSPKPKWLNGNELNEECSGGEFLQELARGVDPRASGNRQWLPPEDSCRYSDHGVLSALRVAQVLTNAAWQGCPATEQLERSALHRYLHALHAIAHHDLMNHTVAMATRPLACLLRICDELQEWGRRRVSVEQVVKQLYLNIEEPRTDAFVAYDSLDKLTVNLVIRPSGAHDRPSFELNGRGAKLRFGLHYRNAVQAHFDPMTTFLGKAYNMQHLDLSTQQRDGHNPLELSIEMRFPVPPEYSGITEFDIYSLFADRTRSLPHLMKFSDLDKVEAGLVRLEDGAGNQPSVDRIAIVAKGPANQRHRHGWIGGDPSHVFSELIDFKKQFLAGRRMART